MLNGALLEKLGGTVKKLLDDKDTTARDDASLQQLAERRGAEAARQSAAAADTD